MPSLTPKYSISANPPWCRISLNIGYSEGSAPSVGMKYCMWIISPNGRFASSMPKAIGKSKQRLELLAYRQDTISPQATIIIIR